MSTLRNTLQDSPHVSFQDRSQDPVYDYCLEFFSELALNGLKHVICSPGSRSAALVLSAHSAGLQILMHHDERSGGFFALGLAKQTRVAAALICTSGSAAANYLPAVVEACCDGVPLLILTADRPPELRDRGAGQTIDQIRLYGSHVRWFADLPVAGDAPAAHARYAAGRAFAEASGGRPGPVHLNFPFREPLEPRSRVETREPLEPHRPPDSRRPFPTTSAAHESSKTQNPQSPSSASGSASGCSILPGDAVHQAASAAVPPSTSGGASFQIGAPGGAHVGASSKSSSRRSVPPDAAIPSEVEKLAAIIQSCERGLLAVGPSDLPPESAAKIIEMAALAGWPVLADAASNLRSAPIGSLSSHSPTPPSPHTDTPDTAASHTGTPHTGTPLGTSPHTGIPHTGSPTLASPLGTAQHTVSPLGVSPAPHSASHDKEGLPRPLTSPNEPAFSVVITTGTHLAAVESFWNAREPEVILRIGHPSATRALREPLARFSSLNILLDPSGRWEEPETFPDLRLTSREGPLCAAVIESLTQSDRQSSQQSDRQSSRQSDWQSGWKKSGSIPSSWLSDWQAAEAAALSAIAETIPTAPLLEAGVARTLGEALPEHSTLYVSNSMPVRDLDAFLAPRLLPLRVMAQRGVNGIDGVVSAAFGVSAGSDGPVILYAGDLALLHDIGGLLRGIRAGLDLTIVVPNNNGGGVFSFLPIADAAGPEEFRDYFHTPHDVDLARLLSGMGARHRSAHSVEELKCALVESIEGGGVAVIEVPVEAAANVAEHRAITKAVRRAVEAAFAQPPAGQTAGPAEGPSAGPTKGSDASPTGRQPT